MQKKLQWSAPAVLSIAQQHQAHATKVNSASEGTFGTTNGGLIIQQGPAS